jgi:eukaryotic-like serine/threonine-protein kinase
VDERPTTTEPNPTSRISRGERTRRLSETRTEPLREVATPRRVVLGRYRLERRLGAGGFGVVWLAFDERLEREVAIKIVARDPGEPVPERAEREARVAARLNHPGIVGLYELGVDDDAVYLVSELVPGRTLAELRAAGAVSDRDVARIGVALCDALAHAHARRVVHRDVKPHNVIVVAEPAAGAGFAKLADFGVAHLASGDPLTRTGDVVGTLAYMAPEQAEGERVTAAADVYSLALTLYECWTGTNPVRGPGAASTARRLGTRLPPLRSERDDLPPNLGYVIDAALDPAPERRPPLDALRAELAAAEPQLTERGGLVEPATLQRVGLTPQTRHHRPPSRRGMRARAAAGIAAGALVLAALELLPARPPAQSLAMAGAVAVATALLPRLAWLAAAAGLVVWLTTPGVDLAGMALLVTLAVVVVPALLPRAGTLWSAPAAAPLLAAAGLGPAFVALAGGARSPFRRAGLAAAGFVWVELAELLAGRRLLLGVPHGAAPPHEWRHSAGAALTDAVWPLVSSGLLIPMAAWVALAVALPLVVRGRSLWLDAGAAALWAGALIAAQHALAPAQPAAWAVAGAVIGAALAVASRHVRAPEGLPSVA